MTDEELNLKSVLRQSASLDDGLGLSIERPKITKQLVFSAASQIAKKIGIDPEIIAKHYRYLMDGYQLAKAIENNECCGFTISDVEELDCLDGLVYELQEDAEKKWAEENNIHPPLPIGAQIRQGKIEGICKHKAASYEVKENGCLKEGRFLIIKFEDARAS
jgi:hypothetical protein